MHFISFQYCNIAVAMAGLRHRPTTPWTIVPWFLASQAAALNEVKNDQQWQRHWNRNKTGKPYDSCMMHGLYFMLYVQWGPTKYFGPKAPQSHNPALPVASEKQNEQHCGSQRKALLCLFIVTCHRMSLPFNHQRRSFSSQHFPAVEHSAAERHGCHQWLFLGNKWRLYLFNCSCLNPLQCLHSDSSHFGHYNESFYLLTNSSYLSSHKWQILYVAVL